MPLLVDLTAALAAGLLAFLAARWYARSAVTPTRPAEEIARRAGEAVRPHRGLRRHLARRVDRDVASGLLLTLALAATLIGGLVLGTLALLVRRAAFIQHVDNSIAAWAYGHRSGASTSGLHAITNLGNIRLVIVFAVLVVLIDAFRSRSGWPALFLVVVLAGMELADTGVKDLVDRVRPTLDPVAATLGPSFPSGHSATAAAFYAAAALIIGRTLRRPARQIFIAAAVAITVGVAASRVLLDLHWTSDVVGGLALGWAWFALAAVVFGGRLLTPTGAADIAAAEATSGNGAGSDLLHEPLERQAAKGSKAAYAVRSASGGATNSNALESSSPTGGGAR
jgi:membrane-associated phospholipid phosphatase